MYASIVPGGIWIGVLEVIYLGTDRIGPWGLH